MADARRRALERAAAHGDHEARARLFIEDLRAGKPVGLIAAEILATLSVRELQALPLQAVTEIQGKASLARHTWPEILTAGTPPAPRILGGWYPSHRRQDVCPNGHTLSFYYNTVGTEFWPAHSAGPDGPVAVDATDQESGGADVEWLACGVCYAAWEAGDLEWE